jgi:catechol 2,3-dioxygenase-like lactoylglutathione lyase family enzyme
LAEIYALDHVQLAMPEGEEDTARGFYRDVLGLNEVAKPAPLAGRGGVWFEKGSLKLHLGTEKDFRPARKAHPALLVKDINAFQKSCEAGGCATKSDSDLPDYSRFYIDDPFGNRIEILEPQNT